jgi:hypothetical protein
MEEKKWYKRYEFWASENGKPVKKWTNFFIWDSDSRDQIQLKGFKGNHLKNEYK